VLTGVSEYPTTSHTIFFRHYQVVILALQALTSANMKLITTAKEMFEFSSSTRSRGLSIGFVPTMGALHSGHISLVKSAKQLCDMVVVSVFVNPTQFNDPSDLQNYPRTFESDQQLLATEGVDVMFFPSKEEIYPVEESKHYDLDGLDELMEGPNRPGHFDGVVQVVTRLFDIVQPNSAFFGEKDFQQLVVIRYMANKLGYSTNIIGCPTQRESSGLAKSSRNVRLSESGKTIASKISFCLYHIKEQFANHRLASEIRHESIKMLSENEGIELEYLEFVNPDTLIAANNQSVSVQACVAVWVEGVRLIDNLQVK
jgi:pantoate--beta-alanine ligase